MKTKFGMLHRTRVLRITNSSLSNILIIFLNGNVFFMNHMHNIEKGNVVHDIFQSLVLNDVASNPSSIIRGVKLPTFDIKNLSVLRNVIKSTGRDSRKANINTNSLKRTKVHQ